MYEAIGSHQSPPSWVWVPKSNNNKNPFSECNLAATLASFVFMLHASCFMPRPSSLDAVLQHSLESLLTLLPFQPFPSTLPQGLCRSGMGISWWRVGPPPFAQMRDGRWVDERVFVLGGIKFPHTGRQPYPLILTYIVDIVLFTSLTCFGRYSLLSTISICSL